MNSVSSVGTFSEKVQTSQPSLTKRGQTLQGDAVNPLSGMEKIAAQETAPPPQTPQKNAIDIRVKNLQTYFSPYFPYHLNQ